MNSQWKRLRAVSSTLAALIFTFSLVTSTGTVHAAGTTITVSTYKDDFANNGNCTLREAIQAANTDSKVDQCPAGSGADTILLSAGTYESTVSLGSADPDRDNNQTGDLDIWSEMTIVGAGRALTIVDGGPITERTFHILRGGKATITDLYITDGSAYAEIPGEEPGDAEGGGVFNQGEATLIRVEITGNMAGFFPGARGCGVSNWGTMTIRQSIIGQNDCDVECVGVEIFNEDRATLLVEYSTISDSPERSYSLIDNGGTARFVGVDMSRNTYRYNLIVNNGTLEIEDSLFTHNNTEEFGDSMFFSGEDSSLVIKNTLFRDNYAASMSTLFQLKDTASFENVTILENRGGIDIEGITTITNSTISANRRDDVPSDEGYINVLPGAALVMNNVTMTGNEAKYSIEAKNAVLAIHNSIVNDTQLQSGVRQPDCSFSGLLSPLSAGYNLISVTDGCGWVKGSGDQTGTLAAPLDPKLDEISKFSITSYVFPLLNGSPAIDRGSSSDFSPTDQRGETRPQDGDGDGVARCDIGAYEMEGQPAPLLEPQVYLPLILN